MIAEETIIKRIIPELEKPDWLVWSETEVAPMITVRPHSQIEEFLYLRGVLSRMTFFKQHGYEVSIPDNHRFTELARLSSGLLELDFDPDWDDLYSVFVNSIYDPVHFLEALKKIQAIQSTIQEKFQVFREYERSWGFVIHKCYRIFLTLYGPGGYAYVNDGVGEIILMVRPDGTTKREFPEHTVLHEIVEFGVRHLVDQYALTHNEKERLVDLICLNGLKLESYQMQELGDSRIDDFVINNLDGIPTALEAYIERYPRKAH